MNLAIIGYGKMGKAIENIALERGHEVLLKINSSNVADLNKENLKTCDVAIEFTGPESAASNIRTCLEAGIPVISGSTGWLHHLNEIEDLCHERGGTFLYASNFSVGVNIFFELNKKLAQLMSSHKEYNVSIEETHHTQKKDAPSGTAITLAEQIINESNLKSGWSLEGSEDPYKITITSLRQDPTPGTHRIVYASPIDNIEIIHTAHNREGFATGAVIAAEYAFSHRGVLKMSDVLGL